MVDGEKAPWDSAWAMVNVSLLERVELKAEFSARCLVTVLW